MRRSIFTGLALLVAAMATAAHAQLMRVTFDTTHIEGDFYEFNAASPDRNEFGNPIHHVHAIAGSLHFETYVDLAAAASPGEPQIFDFRLWGDIDVLGHLDIGPFGLSVTHLPNGGWSLASPYREAPYFGPLIFNAVLTLNPDLSPAGAFIEFRVYGDPEYAQYIFTGGPGLYLLDTTLWVSASADEMTATRVQGPPLTPVPEPATTSSIAALGLCGLIGWRRWLRCRADPERTGG